MAGLWQRLYAAAHALRARWYRQRAGRLPRPVVSIGNLHWGGTGKTPLVAAVAGHLQRRGLAVCILSRGYGGSGRGTRLVSRGDGPLLAPEVAGDEPVLLATLLPGVAIVVDGDRRRGGNAALRLLSPPPDLFLLDDGFSHLRLHRDIDLLVFPAGDPLGGGRLWPGGRLREPLAAASRASAALLTGAGGPDIRTGLTAALRARGFSGPVFAAPTRTGRAILHSREGVVPLAAGSRVLLVSAIGRPERFAAAVRELDFAVMGELRFPDHHAYPAASLARIRDSLASAGADVVLATAKDRVKLLGRLAAPLAELPIAAEPEAAFWTWLDGAVTALRSGGAAR